MSWVAVGVGVGSAAAGIYSSNQAAKASEGAADTAAQAEQNRLNYLMEQEGGSNFYRDQALNELGGYYGLGSYLGAGQGKDRQQYDDYMNQRRELEQVIFNRKQRGVHHYREEEELRRLDDNIAALNFDPNAAMEGEYIPAGQASSQNQFVEDVQQSPFYGSMIREGEQAIGRNLSMTGGLRTGTANEALAQNSQNVLQTLVSDRLRGLGDMARLPSNANTIGQSMANVGGINAQGQVASAQATQQGWQNAITGIGGAVGQYLGAPTPPPKTVPGVQPAPQYNSVFDNKNAFQTYF